MRRGVCCTGLTSGLRTNADVSWAIKEISLFGDLGFAKTVYSVHSAHVYIKLTSHNTRMKSAVGLTCSQLGTEGYVSLC